MPKKKSSSRLAKLESVIVAGLLNMETHTKLVAKALREIHDKKLYAPAYPSFATYVVGRWERHQSWGYRLINLALVAEQLSPLGENEVSERHARELSPLTPDKQREAWNLANTATDGKPTAADVGAARGVVSESDVRKELSELTAQQKLERSRAAASKVRSTRPSGFNLDAFQSQLLFYSKKQRTLAEKHEDYFAAEKIQAVYEGLDAVDEAVKGLEVLKAAAAA